MTDRKPKAVVFDLGKVLVDFDYTIAGRRIAARSKMSAVELQEFLEGSEYTLDTFAGGQLVVGGTFSTAGGVAIDDLALWNGGAFAAIGGGITSTQVDKVYIDNDDNLYLAGNITDGSTDRGCVIKRL